MSLSTPSETVEKLQTSLQTKAKAEPAFRFYALWDKVCRADVLLEFHGRIYRRFVPEVKRYSKARETKPGASARKAIVNLVVVSAGRIALAVKSLRRRSLGASGSPPGF